MCVLCVWPFRDYIDGVHVRCIFLVYVCICVCTCGAYEVNPFQLMDYSNAGVFPVAKLIRVCVLPDVVNNNRRVGAGIFIAVSLCVPQQRVEVNVNYCVNNVDHITANII